MAEIETYHTQKGVDFETLMKEHLDGEIAFYEQVRLANRPVMACHSFSPGVEPIEGLPRSLQ